MDFETVVGFEIHTELLTRTKVFCGCSTAFGHAPNTQTCPVCLGLPGSLPVLNEKALDLALRTAVALNCTITRRTQFERKNYYYPDLPKNYQISQLRKNLAVGGWLDIDVAGQTRRIRLDNIHLEEDAGKNIHPEHPGADYSLVDLNRAGTPLLEIVTQPDIRTLDEAQAFMTALKSLLEYIEVSDCNMHEGRLRFEANISVRPRGTEKLGTKVEIKNLNSMKVVLKCIEAETHRQVQQILDGRPVIQETRLWDEAAGVTRSMRSKEEANDYRYFPDPDLVEVDIDDARIERVRGELPELPAARRQRFIERFGLPEYDAGVLTSSKALADYFEAALSTHGNPKALANWIMTETMRFLNEDPDRTIADYPIAAADLADLVRLIDAGIISGSIAKKVYAAMLAGEGRPDAIVKAKGLVQISAANEIEPIVDQVLAANARSVEDYRNGRERALGALVGQVMKATRGKANPQLVNELIIRKIKG
ncbi:MAG: Asp-tRNA(Asn)/Glu-tRNA(Gln) amidotransferase subunit GatB [bacterium]|nr:Asp-tRNA(Asn)/Glu-tRNA(Gln) amidotransferase subunit GatB [bacterium]